MSVLLGNGDGTFQPAVSFAHGRFPSLRRARRCEPGRAARPRGGERGQRQRERPARQRGWDLPGGHGLTFRAGHFPVSVALGDVNRDGRPDLAVANVGDDTVSVLLGNGDGTFQAAVSFATGSSPTSVALGDVNRDGRPDLAVANGGDDTVRVRLGNGDGTFRAAMSFATGSRPTSVAFGDVNRDGRPDLAVANALSDTVSVLLGNGNGTFRAAVSFATGSSPTSVALGDVNRDGRPDLAVANGGGGDVSVLLNRGDGDDDGVVDDTDNCPLHTNPDQTDTDGDGLGNACDPDDDNDGVSDGADNCPINPDLTDTDGDRLGNACDPDDDNDGLLDGADNCPINPNPDQTDTDLDGLGDACDTDQADLTVTAAASPDPGASGQRLTYTLTVRNNGPTPATGVLLTDDLPDDVALGGPATASQGVCRGTDPADL